MTNIGVAQKIDARKIQVKGSTTSPITHTLSEYKHEIDSIGKVYGINACGYTKTIIDDRETLILFYRHPNGEMDDVIIYTRVLK